MLRLPAAGKFRENGSKRRQPVLLAAEHPGDRVAVKRKGGGGAGEHNESGLFAVKQERRDKEKRRDSERAYGEKTGGEYDKQTGDACRKAPQRRKHKDIGARDGDAAASAEPVPERKTVAETGADASVKHRQSTETGEKQIPAQQAGEERFAEVSEQGQSRPFRSEKPHDVGCAGVAGAYEEGTFAAGPARGKLRRQQAAAEIAYNDANKPLRNVRPPQNIFEST